MYVQLWFIHLLESMADARVTILQNQFDDVVRQRAIDPNAFLPSRFMELQDSRSNKSLAEIYEEDYTTAKERDAGRKVVHELDKDLAKKHDEIEELFEELSGKLDALSNARFTPKPVRCSCRARYSIILTRSFFF